MLTARRHESLFPVLEELGIGFVAFSPLANGFLSARYDKDTKFESGTDYRSVMPQFKLGQISLAWMLCKKPYLAAIPGTRKLARLIENALAADIELTEKEIGVPDRMLDTIEMSEVFGGTRV